MKLALQLFDGDEGKDAIMFTHREWEEFIEEFKLEELAKLLDRNEEVSVMVPVTKTMVDVIDSAYRKIPAKKDHALFDWFLNVKSAFREFKQPLVEARLEP